MKILCSGAPRSGTSMLNLLMSYFKDLRVFMNGTPQGLWENYDLFTTQQRPDGLLWNEYIDGKKHLTDFADEGVKVIYIYRDGRDALISKRRQFTAQGKAFDDGVLLIYEQALLQEGVKLDNPAGFVKRLNKLMEKSF